MMNNPGHQSQDLVRCLKEATRGHSEVVELVCSRGRFIHLLDNPVKIGVEIWQPDQERQFPGFQFVLADVFDYVSERYEKREWGEACMLVDVLEHFTPDKAEQLIKLCQSLFKKIVLFIPIGSHPQGAGVDGNPYQQHQ